MKIQCSCGAKYEFDVTPDMVNNPVRFVCPACGLDSSEFVNSLVRQQLSASQEPIGSPNAPVAAQPVPAKTPALRVSMPTRAPSTELRSDQSNTDLVVAAPASSASTLQHCLKHPGEVSTENCYVCSKPICPKCMELFGYVCSPLCKAKADAQGIKVPTYGKLKSVVEAKLTRRLGLAAAALGLCVAGAIGFWIWYAWFGSIPKPVFSVRFGEPAYSGQSAFAGTNQIVFLHGGQFARYDMALNKEIWSRQLVDKHQIEAAVAQATKTIQAEIDQARSDHPDTVPKMPDREKLARQLEREATEALRLRVYGQNVWIVSPRKLVRYDWSTGAPVKEISLDTRFGQPLSRGDQLLVMGQAADKDTVTRVNLTTCDVRAEALQEAAQPARTTSTGAGSNPPPAASHPARLQELTGLPTGVPGKDAQTPMDPAKVAEQTQHLPLASRIALPAVLANSANQERLMNELNNTPPPQKRGTSRGPPPSAYASLVATEDGFIQFSVRILERRFVTRTAMKAASAASTLEGGLTGAKSAEASNEILNDMQRSRGGDTVEEDESRYQVTLCRPGGQDPWAGQVVGPPALYPLDTVNVLTANKTLIVLDKSNKKRWQSTLNYNVTGVASLDEQSASYGLGPCVERGSSLYVFDQGVLTAFELDNGNVRWRLPSIGITGLFFDDKGMIYVNTTTASPESIKYSRQIDISQKTVSVVMKVDPMTGTPLWTRKTGGLVNYVSGPYVYTVQSYSPDESEDESPYTVDTGFETPPYVRIKRINPKNGHEIWEHFQQRAPLDVEFDKNSIRLVFKKEVQVLRFLTF